MSTPVIIQTSLGDLKVDVSAEVQLGTEIQYPTRSNFDVRYANSDGGADVQSLSIDIDESVAVSTPSITTTSVPNGEQDLVYLANLVADPGGGTADSPAWTVTSGALPAGLTLDGVTGEISGTPTTAGSANFTIQYANTDGGTASRAYSVDIAAAGDSLASFATWRTDALAASDWRHLNDEASDKPWRMNYYDRAYGMYHLNEPDEIARADYWVLRDLNEYMGLNGGFVPPRQFHPDGYAERWLRSGDVGADQPILATIEGMANHAYRRFYFRGYMQPGDPSWEGRIQERGLLSCMLADALNVPSPRYDYRVASRDIFNAIVGTQNVVGSIYNGVPIASEAEEMFGSWTPPGLAYTRTDGNGQCSTNFMAVQAMASMIRYVEYYDSIGDLEAGARAQAIETISNGADYLWDYNWDPAAGAFFYFSHQANEGGPTPAAALTLLFPEVWGWLWNQTGLAKWRDQGDAIHDGGVANAPGFSLSSNADSTRKSFGQQIRGGWRYLYWRDGISLSHLLNPTEVHTP